MYCNVENANVLMGFYCKYSFGCLRLKGDQVLISSSVLDP